MKEEKLQIKLQDLCLYFFICSLAGWILEVIYAFMVERNICKKRIFIWTNLSNLWIWSSYFNISKGFNFKKDRFYHHKSNCYDSNFYSF